MLKKLLVQAVDVYAFGVILWQLVIGEEPWLGLTNDVITAQVVQQKMQLQFTEFEPPEFKVRPEACVMPCRSCMLHTAEGFVCKASGVQANPTWTQFGIKVTGLS